MDISKYSWDDLMSVGLAIVCLLISLCVLSMKPRGKFKVLKPAVLNRDVKYNRRSIQGPVSNMGRDSGILGGMEDVVEEMIVESCDVAFLDESLEEPPFVETVEDLIPEQYRLIPHTSYSVLKKVMDTFINSKRHTRDIGNIDSFIQGGPTFGCARIDALYKVRAGTKSHIAVQDKDQYWAEQEKLFPHLKQMQEDEAVAMDKSQVGTVLSAATSSANCASVIPSCVGKSLVYIRYKNGHQTLPCGTAIAEADLERAEKVRPVFIRYERTEGTGMSSP